MISHSPLILVEFNSHGNHQTALENARFLKKVTGFDRILLELTKPKMRGLHLLNSVLSVEPEMKS